ncbi:virion core protein, T7 gp14 family [Pleomorphomonas diazotrophica]|uniref:virion core protein, T7 gp14 family n=1 Tax=Pleomorphomonas diazotrophica TaxID=1166257 RepID=UPI00117E9DC7|nr:hypothetical protein [Pleomorphomonas diazotrophica]
MTVGGGLLSAAGQISSANAQSKAAKYNAEVQRQNAMLAERQARNVLNAGMREEQKQKAMTAHLMAKQQAAQAANGVDVSFGTPLDLMVDTAKQGAIDALTIRTNAYRNYDDVRNQAVASRNQAALYDMEAKNSRTAGILGAFGSMASTFGSAYASAAKMNPKVSSNPITKTSPYNGGKSIYDDYAKHGLW